MKIPAKSNFLSRVSYQETILFTKHLSTMYRAGIPLTEAISTLIMQTKSPAFRQVLQTILSDVDNGQSLAKALSRHRAVFSQFFVNIVTISEESGTLEANLEFLAKQLAKDLSFRKKIQSALMYPMIVMGVMLTMGVFISLFILPKLVGFFESFNVDLPPSTKALLFIANAFKNYGVYIVIILILIPVALRILLNLEAVKKLWHELVLRIPLFGNLITYGQVARFSRNLGTLIKSGVPIAKSLEVTASTMTNLKFQDDLYAIEKQLTKGKEVGTTMDNKNYWEFPPIVAKMIAVGEKSGKLDEVLLYLSDFYEDEIDDLSKNFSTLLEPVLLIIIAFVVGFVALAIISPIYELTGSIGRQ